LFIPASISSAFPPCKAPRLGPGGLVALCPSRRPGAIHGRTPTADPSRSQLGIVSNASGQRVPGPRSDPPPVLGMRFWTAAAGQRVIPAVSVVDDLADSERRTSRPTHSMAEETDEELLRPLPVDGSSGDARNRRLAANGCRLTSRRANPAGLINLHHASDDGAGGGHAIGGHTSRDDGRARRPPAVRTFQRSPARARLAGQ
jgi:hypothetical protein